MPRKLLLILTLLLFCIGLAFCSDETDMSAELPLMEEIKGAVSAMIDCVSAGFVSEYSSLNIDLPSTAVSMDYESSLPTRMSFFLADPADFVDVMAKHVSNNGSVLGSIRALFNKTADNPYLSAAYLSMASKGYELSDYLLSGSIVFSYPQGSDIDTIENLWLLRETNTEHILFNTDMTFYGLKLSHSMTLKGLLEVYADEQGAINVASYGPFKVNDIETDNIEFQL